MAQSVPNLVSLIVSTLPWFVLFYLVKYCISKINLFFKLKSTPHRRGHFILGDIPYFKKIHPDEPDYRTRMRAIESFYREFNDKKLAVFWRLWEPMIMVYDPEGIAEILSSKVPHPKGFDHRFVKGWIGDGLLESVGEKWHSRRKLITPSFHFQILDQFIPIFVRHTKAELDKWGSKSVVTINLTDVSSKFTLAVLFETALGLNADSLIEYHEQYLEAVERMTFLALMRTTSLPGQLDFTYSFTNHGQEMDKHVQFVHKVSEKAIDLRLAELIKKRAMSEETTREDNENIYLKSKSPKKSLMDTLLECYLDKKDNLTLADIRDEVDTFMFAGHDTTATVIMWALFILGNNLDVQEKLYDELSSSFDPDSHTFDYHTIMTHTYLDACLKECMRLIAPVPAISKTLAQDTKICGHTIPKGLTVILHLFYMHRNPNLYPDPLSFRPERFMSVNDKSAFNFVPFSAGPRNCIGQKYALLEVKIFLTLALLRYSFKSLKKLEDIEYSFEIVTRSKVPLEIECTRRKQ